MSYDGFDTASANLGGGDDGKVEAPTQSSTQKTARHLIRLGRTACGVRSLVLPSHAYPPPGRKLGGVTKKQGHRRRWVRGEERGATKMGEGRGARGEGRSRCGRGQRGKGQGAIEMWERGKG